MHTNKPFSPHPQWRQSMPFKTAYPNNQSAAAFKLDTVLHPKTTPEKL